MITERLKFFADTKYDRNKLFCWKVSILNLEEALFRFFALGWSIRAAWYESINSETGETINQRIDVQAAFEKFCDLSPKNRNFHIKVHIKSSH